VSRYSARGTSSGGYGTDSPQPDMASVGLIGLIGLIELIGHIGLIGQTEND
jgi:hypothetical protein